MSQLTNYTIHTQEWNDPRLCLVLMAEAGTRGMRPAKGANMNAKSITLLLGLGTMVVMAACAAPQRGAAPTPLQSDTPPAAPTILPAASPTEPPAEPTEPPAEEELPPTQPAPAQPVATLRPHVEPVDEIGETGERVTGEAPQPLLDAILDDAAARTGLDRSELTVVQDQAVVWPDGSLGCPEPGMMYTMSLVDGHHVIVRAGEQALDYRTGRNDFFKLCANPAPLGRGGFPTR